MGALQELAGELRIDEAQLDFLGELDDTQRELILQGLRNAKARQKRQLDDAVQESLNHIPRILHGPVRKILFRNR